MRKWILLGYLAVFLYYAAVYEQITSQKFSQIVDKQRLVALNTVLLYHII